jgi:hypothetical protein
MENTENTGAVQENVGETAPKAPGIGDVAKDLIRAGLGNKEVLDKVKELFPDAKTSMASINWYRNNLRDAGEDVPTAREIAAAGKPTKEELEAAKAEKKAAKDKERQEAKDKKAAEKKAAKDAEKQAKADAKAAEKQAGEQTGENTDELAAAMQ